MCPDFRPPLEVIVQERARRVMVVEASGHGAPLH